ncbi:MAG TPA: glutamate-5-semialdehyde dehydrogenase [Candidatus Sumerlaeota bacterium]|nr:glutamate-5-semialdehyde dehydrogenase [Candidatus Sumerlaeota bacterium]HON50007.1 glutamate-5-semialdehyde dehydrogenase [Candidatus Sumerlaeota bacterium]HOR65860.1 glutamate-5-semialdehyde dehydrogenase [Candidatus Sumerlaeota bacterium]HPL75543.1 glutamate-5-semialdehyde dehydrogenase [Candidatus Sumerlaeota bacterium]HRR30589.1 glutamate-5-semialdehyde dehydrogenase [Candidatus Sumerlaeia bacterium]
MVIQQLIETMGRKAKNAAAALAVLKPEDKNRALRCMADAFLSHRDEIKIENQKDMNAGEDKGLSKAMLDRLLLNDKRIDEMAQALRAVAELDDPVGEIFDMRVRPNGIKIGRMRCPIGVIGIIYESRPNVTADAACLCVKSGNAVILRGGSEAINSNRILARLMSEAGIASGLPEGSVQLVDTVDRAAVTALLHANQYIDLIIPRGGTALIKKVTEESTIPVIKHYSGNCFIYVDETADLEQATAIIENAKTQRPGVCNALETLLINRKIAASLLGKLAPILLGKKVELRGDPAVCEIVPQAKPAKESDWEEEYLDLILAVRVVDSLDEAVELINRYGSHHTDAILTKDYGNSMKFLTAVDSACVFVNCSTRFADGGEFGMGCEIGISTDKLHARGPMALKELTTAKFIALGGGQIKT